MRSGLLICECVHTAHIGAAKIQAVRAHLEAAGIPYTAVSDLCELAARKDPLLKSFAAGPNPLILACYPRTIRALFEFAGTPLASHSAQVINLRETPAEEALAQVQVVAGDGTPGAADRAGTLPPVRTPEPPDGTPAATWMPWFPVLDAERCNQCQQCLGFCLFGVYGLSPEGTVTVENPQACKANCPACARICPQAAIIFPKYEAGVIAGAEVTDAALEQSLVKTDLSKLFGSDAYAALAQRRRKGRSQPLLRPDLATARNERKEFLEKSGLGHLLNAETPPSSSPAEPPTSSTP